MNGATKLVTQSYVLATRPADAGDQETWGVWQNGVKTADSDGLNNHDLINIWIGDQLVIFYAWAIRRRFIPLNYRFFVSFCFLIIF